MAERQLPKRVMDNKIFELVDGSVQSNSVIQSCPTLCDPMNCRTSGLPVHHQLQEFTVVTICNDFGAPKDKV